jgi:hypothetical protein
MRIEFTDIVSLSREEWDLVYDNNQTVSVLTYDVMQLFLTHFNGSNSDSKFGRIISTIIVKIFVDNNLVTIIPFVLIERNRNSIVFRSIEFISQQFGGPYLGPIGAKISDKTWLKIRKELKSNYKFDFLQLRYITDNSIFKNNIYCNNVCPIIEIRNFDNYGSFSQTIYDSKFRYNLRSRFKKFVSNGGSLNVKSFNALSESELLQIQEVSASKEQDGKIDVIKDMFVWEYIINNMKLYNNRIVFAKLNNVIVAFQYSIYIDSIHIYSNLAYNRDFKQFGLGNLIDNFEIEMEDFGAIKYISMGPGFDSYKKKFATGYQPLFTYITSGNTIRGRLITAYLIRKLNKVDLYWRNQLKGKKLMNNL